MKLSSMFGGIKPLASASKPATPTTPTAGSQMAEALSKRKKAGEFPIVWPKVRAQQVKDYKVILDEQELVAYLQRCIETGKASFDWETAASEREREEWIVYESRMIGQINEFHDRARIVLDDMPTNEDLALQGLKVKEWKAAQKPFLAESEEWNARANQLQKELDAAYQDYLRSPLDPHRSDVCTVSISAAPDECRVIPISHKVGRNIYPVMTRDAARQRVMDLLGAYIFRNESVMKIAVNMPYEVKYATKYKKYLMGKVADPLMMWVRCMQILQPQKIKDPSKPFTGWGLKPATKAIFGVEMNDFKTLLDKHGVEFFDEIAADSGDGLAYSAEDSDYGLQQYDYWDEVARQVELPEDCPNRTYSDWLHNVEMPFTRVTGSMEFHGMGWDPVQADVKRQEAEIEQEKTRDRMTEIGRMFGKEVDPGKTGKNGAMQELLFDVMGCPVSGWTDKKAIKLDAEALIDMKFMIENKLVDLSEEKYLDVPLPEGWEALDPDKDPHLDKDQRGAVRIAQRPPYEYHDLLLELLGLMGKIQKMTTLLSFVARERHVNKVTGKIHASFGPWTDTSRLMSEKPNGQNYPRPENDSLGIRGMFVPGVGKVFFYIDFAGFELRILAWRAEDGVMIELFNTGGDMHRKTASELAGKPEEEVTKKERTDAKPANFGITYGGTEHALQKVYKTDYGMRKTLDFCKRAVDAVKKAYEGIPRFQRQAALDARERGWSYTALGYIRLLTDINSSIGKLRGSDERRAANTPIQGSAADFMKVAQNKVYDEVARGTYIEQDAAREGCSVAEWCEKYGLDNPILSHGKTDMISQIHDEMIFEMDDDPDLIEQAGKWIQSVMEQPPVEGFPVPILADPSVGYRWNAKEEFGAWLNKRRAV